MGFHSMYESSMYVFNCTLLISVMIHEHVPPLSALPFSVVRGIFRHPIQHLDEILRNNTIGLFTARHTDVK